MTPKNTYMAKPAYMEELSGMRMERASYGQMANVAKHRQRRLTELRRSFHEELSREAREKVIQFLTAAKA